MRKTTFFKYEERWENINHNVQMSPLVSDVLTDVPVATVERGVGLRTKRHLREISAPTSARHMVQNEQADP